MADVKGNKELAKAKLRLEIAEMELNIQRSEVRLMQLAEEKETIETNIEASEKWINNKTKELEGIE